MHNRELIKSIYAVWVIVSAFLLVLLVALLLLPETLLLFISSEVQLPHHNQETCFLCGMTRSFIAISRGKFNEAMVTNSWSTALYLIIVLNELMVFVFLSKRLRK